MKLQNNQTGQVENFCIDKDQICSCDRAFVYDSLKQLREAGWEDYEEPKEYWYIDTSMMEVTYNTLGAESDVEEFNKQIGNYFETEEEAEKAVEELKAWKRLRDAGFKFNGYFLGLGGNFSIKFETGTKCNTKDLELLFGGEE